MRNKNLEFMMIRGHQLISYGCIRDRYRCGKCGVEFNSPTRGVIYTVSNGGRRVDPYQGETCEELVIREIIE